MELQGDLKELAVVEERNRLAREIHDGLGASLSSLIIQSRVPPAQLAKDEAVLKEIGELKASAEESIEELRRNLRMMREDFELAAGLEDYVKTFRDRTQLQVRFERGGVGAAARARRRSSRSSGCSRSASPTRPARRRPRQVDVRLHFGARPGRPRGERRRQGLRRRERRTPATTACSTCASAPLQGRRPGDHRLGARRRAPRSPSRCRPPRSPNGGTWRRHLGSPARRRSGSIVVEDQTKILKNQLKLLEGQPELTIVGTALSGEAALEAAAAAAARRAAAGPGAAAA